MRKKTLLLHTCCAPCIAYVYELLRDDYKITAYFYNPNISPKSEYHKRLRELERFSNISSFSLITGEYNIRDWTQRVREYRLLGEKSKRCWECYHYRLEETFRKALELNMDAVTTVLSISPHKDARMLNKIGKELELQYNIHFIDEDFKKRDGYKKSLYLSKKYGFYRQDYCGCVYSKLERRKDSAWVKKAGSVNP